MVADIADEPVMIFRQPLFDVFLIELCLGLFLAAAAAYYLAAKNIIVLSIRRVTFDENGIKWYSSAVY